MHKQLILIIFTILFVQQSTISAQNQHKVTFGEIKEQGRIWGIDISHHQSRIDWDRIKEEKPHFIFLKATEGTTNQDSKYSENYKNAKDLDILVGSYHFFTYKSSGKDQAQNFLSTAKYKNGDLPLVLDAEFAKKMPAKRVVQNELVSFINTVYKKTGHYPMIYCDYDYYKLYMKDRLPSRIKLWIVDYKEKPDCDWTFWQTTNKFKLAGIKGNVDFNMFNGSKRDLERITY